VLGGVLVVATSWGRVLGGLGVVWGGYFFFLCVVFFLFFGGGGGGGGSCGVVLHFALHSQF